QYHTLCEWRTTAEDSQTFPGVPGPRLRSEVSDREEAVQLHIRHLLASVELGEFQQEGESHDRTTCLAHQIHRGSARPAGGKYVVDDEHTAAGCDRIGVDLHGRSTVLQIIGLRDRLCRPFPHFARRYETCVSFHGHGRTEEETPSFQAHDVVHAALAIGGTHPEHGFPECLTAVEKRSDVLEEDSGAGEVRDLANVLAEQLGTVHVFDVCGSVDHVRCDLLWQAVPP